MTPKTDRYTKEEDRILALLALASQETGEKGECPTVDELEIFGNGKSSPQKRREIMAHLNTCPTCYSEWLTMPPPPRESFWDRLSSDIAMFLETCLSFMGELSRTKQFLCAASAIMAILVGIFIYQDGNMDRQISQSYQMVLAQKTAVPYNDRLPWEKRRRMGFAGSARYTPEYRAFGSGLWTGRQRLAAQTSHVSMPDFLSPGWDDTRNPIRADQWSDTPYARYFWLGEWSLLVRSLCLSDSEIPQDFLDRQADISERLKQDFKDTEFVYSKLGDVELLLKKSDHRTLSQKQRHDIASGLYSLINRLSPKRIP